MDIILNGANGRMGRTITEKIDQGYEDYRIVAKVDPHNGDYASLSEVREKGDVVIDFSNHQSTHELLSYCLKTKTPLVIATTGQTKEEKEEIREASEEIPIFFSYNMSLGIAVMSQLVKKAAFLLSDSEIEIVEIHHDQKLDAPSGTALLLADCIKQVRPNATVVIGRNGHHKRDHDEIGISSIRIGNVVGIHEVMLSTGKETLTIRHEAYDRALFADGALKAAGFIVNHTFPRLYDMNDLVK